jgi:hypothetical protein
MSAHHVSSFAARTAHAAKTHPQQQGAPFDGASCSTRAPQALVLIVYARVAITTVRAVRRKARTAALYAANAAS